MAGKYGYPEEILGTWECRREDDNNYYHTILEIRESGYYSYSLYRNGNLVSERFDIWYMPNDKSLKCIIDGNMDHYAYYRYKDGKLYQGDEDDDSEFSKI